MMKSLKNLILIILCVAIIVPLYSQSIETLNKKSAAKIIEEEFNVGKELVIPVGPHVTITTLSSYDANVKATEQYYGETVSRLNKIIDGLKELETSDVIELKFKHPFLNFKEKQKQIIEKDENNYEIRWTEFEIIADIRLTYKGKQYLIEEIDNSELIFHSASRNWRFKSGGVNLINSLGSGLIRLSTENQDHWVKVKTYIPKNIKVDSLSINGTTALAKFLYEIEATPFAKSILTIITPDEDKIYSGTAHFMLYKDGWRYSR